MRRNGAIVSEENLRELYRQHRQAEDKLTYFLLAAAASAIALTIKRTEGLPLDQPILMLGGAVGCWGFSFFFGCRHLTFINSTLYANFDLLRVQSGTHPAVPRHPQHIAAAAEGIKEAMEGNVEQAVWCARWQFRLLILGAVLYIAWHVFGMYAQTP